MTQHEALAPGADGKPLPSKDDTAWRRPLGTGGGSRRVRWTHRSRLLSFPVTADPGIDATPPGVREYRLEENAAAAQAEALATGPVVPRERSVTRTLWITASLVVADLAAFAAAVAITSTTPGVKTLALFAIILAL